MKRKVRRNNSNTYSLAAWLSVVGCVLSFTFFAGCKKEEVAPPPAAPIKKAAAPVQTQITTVKKAEYVYDRAGKRDPFKPFIELVKKAAPTKVPTTPLQAYDLNDLRLVGVLILPGKKVAMIEDPTGKGYSVKEGTLIGVKEGKVVEIMKDEVVVEEKYLDDTGQTKTMRVSIKIPREQGGEGR